MAVTRRHFFYGGLPAGAVPAVGSNRIKFLGFALILFIARAHAQPIGIHPDNPHYYLFQGQPTVLITSAEHYGAVVNKDFDYVAYLDALKAYGLNYTRVWPGAVLEMVGEFVKGNTMGPRPGRTIVPWARSNQPGYIYGGNKLFTAEDPAGRTPDNAQVLGALRNLKDFIYSFDFVKMRADKNFVASGLPKGVYCRRISQPGEQHALYHHHSQLDERSHQFYIPMSGSYRETFVLDLPAGTYKADWVDPASGSVLGSATFSHQGGNQVLNTPEHRVDIALRIKRTH